jgi:hypothetical protein
MATKNPTANQTWYTAKGKQVFDSANVPISRKEVDTELERNADKVERNTKTAKKNPELKDISDFANEGVTEQIRQLRKARQANIGGGRGEVNPEGMKKGGKVSSASSRADGCCVKGKTKGRYL